MAYCVTAATIDYSLPSLVLAPKIHPVVVDNEVYLQCSYYEDIFNDKKNFAEVGFTVKWLKEIDGQKIELFSIDTIENLALLNASYFSLGTKVLCDVQSYFIGNSEEKTLPESSEVFYPGIRASPDKMNISENGTFHVVSLESTLPLVCPEGGDDCSVVIHLRTVTEKDTDPDITLSVCSIKLVPQECSQSSHCGIVTFLVTAIVDFIDEQLLRRSTILLEEIESDTVPLWNGYNPADIKVQVSDIPSAQCYSFTDPHFITLDKRKYDYYGVGTFVLYKSTARDFEVDCRIWNCGEGVSCNCGFVVKEEGDIVAVDMCSGEFLNTQPEVTIKSKLPLSTGVKIKEAQSGNKITIEMPSGAFIRADLSDWGISISVQGPSVDFNSTVGLCGTFNGNPDDDFHDKNRETMNVSLTYNQANEFVEQWRLRDGGLFKNLPEENFLYHRRRPINFCTCVEPVHTRSDLTRFPRHCSDHDNVKRPAVILSLDKTAMYENAVYRTRKRRHHGSEVSKALEILKDLEEEPDYTKLEILEQSTVELHFHNYEDIYDFYGDLPDYINVPIPVVRRWPTPTGITYREAVELCHSMFLNTTIDELCGAILPSSIVDALEICVSDIQLTEDFTWNHQSRALVENQCEETLVRNFTREKREDIIQSNNVLHVFNCPNDCSGNGQCIEELGCYCKEGFSDIDCSVQDKKVPTIRRLDRNGLCMTRGDKRGCESVLVNGRGFRKKKGIVCRLAAVIQNDEVQELDILNPNVLAYFAPGEYINKKTVLCNFSDSSAIRHSLLDLSKWFIGVSNGGTPLSFSNSMVYTVYEELCNTCNIKSCSIKSGTCLINGRCYLEGDKNPFDTNQECRPSIQNAWTLVRKNELKNCAPPSCDPACPPGYVGFGCRIAICQPDCKNGGRCLSPGTCQCQTGYHGKTCETAICEPQCENGGRCTAHNVCTCPYGYVGSRCETMICNKHCENGGFCSSPDVCSCSSGWSGPTCSLAVCIPHCQNGVCAIPGYCLCQRGYYGVSCERGICSQPCQNGGKCTRRNMCKCPPGYGGKRCERVQCNPRCQYGRCLKPNTCSCRSGYKGRKCQKPICSSDCRNNGVCVKPNICTCAEGWTGASCQTPVCRQKCFYGGRCIGPDKCRCRRGFAGSRCEKREQRG